MEFFRKIRSVFRFFYWTTTFLISVLNIVLYVEKIIHPTDLYYFHLAFLIISIIVFIANIILFIERYRHNKFKKTITTSRRYLKLVKILLTIVSSNLTIFSFTSITSLFGLIFLPILIIIWSINILVTILQIVFTHMNNKRQRRKAKK